MIQLHDHSFFQYISNVTQEIMGLEYMTVTGTTSVLIKYSHIFESLKQWLVHITTRIMKHTKVLWKMECKHNDQYKNQR
jgi:hypothetical protein